MIITVPESAELYMMDKICLTIPKPKDSMTIPYRIISLHSHRRDLLQGSPAKISMTPPTIPIQLRLSGSTMLHHFELLFVLDLRQEE
jgi:hypothetical protein